jgi:hypothetical protein
MNELISQVPLIVKNITCKKKKKKKTVFGQAHSNFYKLTLTKAFAGNIIATNDYINIRSKISIGRYFQSLIPRSEI